MRPIHIDICNERLLPRFGVDRLLVLLARRLVAQGHAVRFVCLRCDRPMLEAISPDIAIIELPAGLDMGQTEAAADAALTGLWQARRPDVAVIGGWPFFGAAARAGERGSRSVFIDAGAVAQDALPEPLLSMQRELRRIRALSLPAIDRVLPISSFIRFSQTEPDRGGGQGVRTVLLGGDHMALGLFGRPRGEPEGQALLASLDAQIADGARLVLSLGRFEAQGYKNSRALYRVLRDVRGQVPRVLLLLLDAGEDCAIPADLRASVILLGTPDDQTLGEIMQRSHLGLSPSLWEGYNLPIAEMQWLDRPVLAFNLAAHPEVAADPWLLCGDPTEMAGKAVAILRSETPLDLAPRFAAFRRRQRWDITLDAWEAEIVALAQTPPGPGAAPTKSRRIVLVDVTNAAQDPANPGVIRVVRRLCAELQAGAEVELVPVSWDGAAQTYAFLDATRRGFLERFGGPTDGLGLLAEWSRAAMTPERLIAAMTPGRPAPPVLFLPEVILDDQAATRIAWARRHGCRTAALLHDLIPHFHREFCDAQVVRAFPGYLRALADVDAIWSNSFDTERAYRAHAEAAGLGMPPSHDVLWLPGQFGTQPRRHDAPADVAGREIRVLCVSTLEPRKNHLRLLEGFRLLLARRPDLPIRLILVGNRYAGSPEIAAEVEQAIRRESRIEWRGITTDEQLAAEFDAADFSVYASLVEGFGLPILESLWMGRPCLTHNAGVMLELATPGGCLPVDMTDAGAIADGIERLASDRDLARRLRQEAQSRPIATWREYADAMSGHLARLAGSRRDG